MVFNLNDLVRTLSGRKRREDDPPRIITDIGNHNIVQVAQEVNPVDLGIGDLLTYYNGGQQKMAKIVGTSSQELTVSKEQANADAKESVARPTKEQIFELLWQEEIFGEANNKDIK